MGYGGSGGGYSGESKYDSYDSKSYGKNSSKADSYGLSNPFGTYGEYNYNKSTLDKYKGNESKNKTISTTSPTTTNITGKITSTTTNKPSIVPT